MNKDPLLFLTHIFESIEYIEEYTFGKDFEEFLEDTQLQDSVIRRIEIIGEAAKNLNDDIKEQYPDVPWKDIIGMRDVVVHGYFGVDPKIVWNVVIKDIPSLKNQIETIIAAISEEKLEK